MRKISRRNFLLTAGVVSAAALLAACGNSASAVSSESASESTASSVESAASNETVEYPITIQHAYGETVIEEKPKSIVAIAWGNPDVPLALGVVPTGVSKANFGPVNEDGLLPDLKSWVHRRMSSVIRTAGIMRPSVIALRM